jgi:hypothetical protein
MERQECPECITKPQMVEVRPNVFTCPVCDITIVRRPKVT